MYELFSFVKMTYICIIIFYTFIEVKNMPKLDDEIKRLNQSKRIKIHLNKIPQGYSLYLEYNIDYRRERTFLNMKVSGKENITKKDAEVLYKAEITRDLEELELYGNERGFSLLKNKISEADFIEFFDAIAKKKKLPSYHGSLQQLKTFTHHFYKTSYLKFNLIDVKFCSKFKEYLLEQIENEELANQTAKTYLTVFSAALNKAVEEKIIFVNPCAKISIKGIEAKREFLTEEELKLFIQVDTPYIDIKNSFVFSTQTSLRLGDIRALTFKDIRSGFIYFRQRKNKTVSNMKLSNLALTIIQEQKKLHDEGMNVFQLPVSRSDINKRLEEIASQATINKHIHYHVSRHTFATLALARGIDIYTVSKWMGHSSVAITEIYANLINKKRDEVADIINIEITKKDRKKKKKKKE
jgi:integrase